MFPFTTPFERASSRRTRSGNLTKIFTNVPRNTATILDREPTTDPYSFLRVRALSFVPGSARVPSMCSIACNSPGDNNHNLLGSLLNVRQFVEASFPILLSLIIFTSKNPRFLTNIPTPRFIFPQHDHPPLRFQSTNKMSTRTHKIEN